MSWTAVAKKDFSDAVRSRSLWALSVLFVLLVAGLAYAFATLLSGSGADEEISTLGFVVLLQSPAGLFISIAGLLGATRPSRANASRGASNCFSGSPTPAETWCWGRPSAGRSP